MTSTRLDSPSSFTSLILVGFVPTTIYEATPFSILVSLTVEGSPFFR